MKLSKMALVAAIACGIHAGSAFGQQAGNGIQKVSFADCDCGQPACGCEDPAAGCDASCDGACDGAGGCDGASGCGSGCGLGLHGMLGGFDCDELDEPWTLFKGQPLGFTVGGWSNVGYHSSRNAGGGITNGGAPANFNTYDNRVQLQQQWLYAEKVADGSNGLGFGGRIDYLYGTDAPDTQPFGIADDHFTNSWDNGGQYGHAIPQLYGEVAYNDTSVKFGHFFTIIGNEVVAATGNFFYSRQFTFYNAEPFTHTGVLATHQLNDDTTIYGGYVTGWDSGFKDNGDTFIGGIKRQFTDRFSLLYTTAIGRFNDDENSTNARERGSIHSFIATTQLTDKLTNLIQYDHLGTEDETGAIVRNTHGLNVYFIYQVNDRVALGSRSEYFNWSVDAGSTGRTAIDNANLFNQTYGVNYKVSSNLMVRPEGRWIWDYDRTGANEDNRREQFAFGMDAIYTF